MYQFLAVSAHPFRRTSPLRYVIVGGRRDARLNGALGLGGSAATALLVAVAKAFADTVKCNI